MGFDVDPLAEKMMNAARQVHRVGQAVGVALGGREQAGEILDR